MTEKRYILESPADLTAARSAMRAGGLSNSHEIEIAIDSLVDRFLAPVPKIFMDKFEWMKQCAALAAAALSFLPDTAKFEEFYTTDTEINGGTPGKHKVTTYDAPDGVPSTAQALGMTVEEKEADSPRFSKTRLAAAAISGAIIEVDDKRAAEIRKAFKPMILPIWDDEGE